MNYSVWSDTVKPKAYPVLNQDISCDALVIGGGMAGVLTAYFLQHRGVETVLLEGKTLGNGITKNTTAVLSAQHDTLYSDMIKTFGAEKARGYLKANLCAVDAYRKLSGDIPCDFEDKPSLMYTLRDKTVLEREAEALQDLGFNAAFTTDTELPLPVTGAVCFHGMAQFHPLKFLQGIAEKLTIYENTFANKIKDNTVYTKNGKITAKHIVIATHYPFINSKGLYFMKLHQVRSYVTALEQAQQLKATYVSHDEKGLYFRSHKDLLLVGGEDTRTGKLNNGYEPMRQFTGIAYPNAKEKYAWATQDCMSLDGVPYIGRYSRGSQSLYVATGFNEWGMTSSMVSADILSDMICGKENEFAPVFSPQRSILRKQLFANMGTTFLNFIKPTPKRCPHLGCALKYNRKEKSWDCPCHGSRFDENGKLIDNPAIKDAHV